MRIIWACDNYGGKFNHTNKMKYLFIFYIIYLNNMKQSGNRQVLQTKMHQEVLSIYTSKEYLTQHSLYSNLFSSQAYNMSSTLNENFTSLYFGKQTIQENQLYQFTYFHKRDKKILFYFFILEFLTTSPKNQMVVFENGEKFDTLELRNFLSNPKYGGSQDIVDKLNSRVSFFRGQTHQVYKLNLQFLSLYAHENQFLKVVVLCDINQFQSGDKSSLERIYKKINKNMLVLSFKKEIYDYKFIQKTSNPYIEESEENNQSFELHQKVTKNVNRRIEGFKSHHSYLIPIEHIGIPSKSLEETYRSVIIRKDENNELCEYIFSAWPFETKAYRKIN